MAGLFGTIEGRRAKSPETILTKPGEAPQSFGGPPPPGVSGGEPLGKKRGPWGKKRERWGKKREPWGDREGS